MTSQNNLVEELRHLKLVRMNIDLKTSAEYKRFLNYCNREKIHFKFIFENGESSWIEGPMDNMRARTILDTQDDAPPMKPLPPLPLNYKSLYADQNKTCSYAAEIVKQNSTSGNLGEGIYFICPKTLHFSNQISSRRKMHYLSNRHST